MSEGRAAARCQCFGCQEEAANATNDYCALCNDTWHSGHCPPCQGILASSTRQCPHCGVSFDGWLIDLSIPWRTTALCLRSVERSFEFELARGGSVVVGRQSEGVDVCLPTPTVARRHARFFERDGRWYVEDLGSHCGVQVNERTMHGPAQIRPGDVVRVGGVRLTVFYGSRRE